MMGRGPRLPHGAMRWLIISLMLINGVQLVLLQLAINSSALYNVGETWMYVGISFAALVLSTGLLAYAFLRSRSKDKDSQVMVKPASPDRQGTVSSNELREQK